MSQKTKKRQKKNCPWWCDNLHTLMHNGVLDGRKNEKQSQNRKAMWHVWDKKFLAIISLTFDFDNGGGSDRKHFEYDSPNWIE